MKNEETITTNNDNLGMGKGTLILLYGFLTVALLVPIWIVKYFPAQNGPEYLLFVHMLKEFNNPAFNYSDYYESFFLVVPNLLFHILVYLLSYLMPLGLASKVTLSLCVIIFPLSVFYIIGALDSRKLFLGFAAFPYVYNHFIPKGYNSYYLSIPLFFFFFGYLIKHAAKLDLKKSVYLSILVFLIYLAHMFSFLLAIFIAAVYVLSQRLGIKTLAKLAGIFTPSLILFCGYIFYILNQSKHLVSSERPRIIYSTLAPTFEYFVTMYMYSYTYLAVLLFLISLSVIICMIVKRRIGDYIPLIFDKNKRRLADLVKSEPTFILVVSLSIIFFLLPREILGWGKFNTRLLPFIFILMVVSAEPFSRALFNRIFLGVNALITVAIVGLISFQVLTIDKVLNDYLSGVPIVKKNPTILPVHLEYYQAGKIKPLHWAFNYYNFFKGGASGQSVVKYTGRVPMKYKKPIKELFPKFDPENPQEANMNEIKRCYNYVLFWGNDSEIFGMFERYGFKLIHGQGKLRVYENSSLINS